MTPPIGSALLHGWASRSILGAHCSANTSWHSAKELARELDELQGGWGVSSSIALLALLSRQRQDSIRVNCRWRGTSRMEGNQCVIEPDLEFEAALQDF